MMSTDKYAFICEGNAEKALIKFLIENQKIQINNTIIKQNNLFLEGIFKERNAKKFCEKYLNIDMDFKLIICRILDSEKENFNIPKQYELKVKDVINIVTKPEIEILIIINENKYDDYLKLANSKKPSIFVKEQLKINKDFASHYAYWQNCGVESLCTTLKRHKKYKHNKNTYKNNKSFYDIINTK